MVFRPLPLLTAFSVAALALLITLGVWQLDRMGWKAEQTAAWQARQIEPARPLEALLCSDIDPAGRRVMAVQTGEGPNVQVYGRGPNGEPGWRQFTAVPAPSCLEADYLLAETAFEPLFGAAPIDAEGLVVSAPLGSGPFTPSPTLDAAEFYAFDPDAMAQVLERDPSGLYRAFWLAGDDGTLPAVLSETPPSRHFGYAITWFGLALALLGVYLAFHWARGRLSFHRT